ncbi:MAG: ATP-dependent sacrificial sulfur transferase LarE, partial [Acidimicrobiales bacterium]|nr:ATP-dependent sacrificial sulfur transferase LarE [Acidimicrobiales bacterium]
QVRPAGDGVVGLTSKVPTGLRPPLRVLAAALEPLERVVVAFSGGADSAFLSFVATACLGAGRVRCLTAVSPSLAPEELSDCEALAQEWGLSWRPVRTDELARPDYVANQGDRCYHCKAELMAVLDPVARAEGATVVLGVNLDDLGDHRPGQQAAVERGATFPLVTAGFTKAMVREASLALGLRTWDKPAAACLASRVPEGTPVTLSVLSSVARAESGLRRLGFAQLRVRHYGELARIEVELSDLPEVVARREAVVEAVKGAGYRYVTLDLEGFRSGNLDGVNRANLNRANLERPDVSEKGRGTAVGPPAGARP